MDFLRLACEGGSGIISAATLSVRDSPSWVVVGGAVAVLLLLMVSNSMRGKYSNLPPGPRNWPVIGAMLEMEAKVPHAFAKLAKRHGPILYLRLGVQPIVVVSSAEIAEELLRHKDGQFADKFAPMNRAAAKYVGFDGGSFPYADHNAENILRRKLAFTEFFTGAKLKTYEELRRQEMAAMVEKVFNTIESTNNGHEFRDNSASAKSVVTVGINAMVHAMVQNIIFALVIGERFDKLSPTNHLREFPELLQDFMRLAMAFNVADIFPSLRWFDPQSLMKDYKAFGIWQQEFYAKIVRDRRRLRQLEREGKSVTDSKVTERNFVDVLLDAQEEGDNISDNLLYGTLNSLLSAGIDTTSTQVEWTMLELARHPKMLQRLQAEVDGVVGLDRPVVEADIQLQNMPFLVAFVTEVIRLHPTVPITFPHVNRETTILGGYTIPANTAVLLNIPIINRDPRAWKDPLQFNPERFMGDEGEKVKVNGTNYNLLTFSSGRRGCLGYNLAWAILLRTTATLVHAFDWSPPPGLSPTDLSAEEKGTVVYSPIVDLFLTPKPRVSCNLYHNKVAP